MPRTILTPPPRRRRSPLPMILIVLALLFVGLLIWLSTRSTEVPQQRIEQDVTNEALAK
jgi:sensor domain CHASE-containing protein